MKRKKLILLLKLLITIGLLAYIFSLISVEQLLGILKQVSLIYFLFSFLVALCTRLVDAYHFQLLTRGQGLNLTFLRILEVNLITSFYGHVLPGYIAGGAIRWYRLAKYDKKPVHILAAILFNRAIELGILSGVGLLSWLLDKHPSKMPILGLFFTLIILATLFGFILTSLDFGRFRPYLKRVPLLNRDFFWNVLDSLKLFFSYNFDLKLAIIGTGLAKHLLSIFTFYFMTKALGLNVSILSLSYMRSFLSIIALLPISFSGVGVRDISLVHLLAPFGVSAQSAISLAFAILARMFMINTIGGILELRHNLKERE